jgi:hypothetical protein
VLDVFSVINACPLDYGFCVIVCFFFEGGGLGNDLLKRTLEGQVACFHIFHFLITLFQTAVPKP